MIPHGKTCTYKQTQKRHVFHKDRTMRTNYTYQNSIFYTCGKTFVIVWREKKIFSLVFVIITWHLLNIRFRCQILKCKSSLRYVDVIWLLFHVLQLLLVRFTKQNLCCIGKSTTNININKMENRISPTLLSSLEVHVCWFRIYIHRPSLLCSIVSV